MASLVFAVAVSIDHLNIDALSAKHLLPPLSRTFKSETVHDYFVVHRNDVDRRLIGYAPRRAHGVETSLLGSIFTA
ncbi:MAG: hypothetical protein EBV97_17865 [Rhodobacteraceae bacterium]|nr:hypothetical protein [Paracoccaceae bacterium]